ncbi:hypothetical protein ABK046_46750, partial [Streptomyces caeruleatus]
WIDNFEIYFEEMLPDRIGFIKKFVSVESFYFKLRNRRDNLKIYFFNKGCFVYVVYYENLFCFTKQEFEKLEFYFDKVKNFNSTCKLDGN